MGEAIESREDLEAAMEELRRKTQELEDLGEEVQRLENLIAENVEGVHIRLSRIDDQIERLQERVEDLEKDARVAEATTSAKKQSKIERATDVLQAADRKGGGPSGVVVDTGDVIGAASCSRSRAQGLIDEMAGALEDAEVKRPGGPNPKQLRLPIGHRAKDVDELVDELIDAWGVDEEEVED